MAKLTWVEKFIAKELYAPYVVEKDEDYYEDLKGKYRMLIQVAKNAGADEESLKILRRYSKKVIKSVKLYYDASISEAHNTVKN